MKLVVTTTYSNLSQAWLDWYIERLGQNPQLEEVANTLNERGYAEFTSDDPTSTASATTTYEVKP